jgi:hypothetical protein
MKPKISICKNDIVNIYGTLGLTEILNVLINSNEFEVVYHNDKIPTAKSERSTLIYYNNKKILIDFWDYAMPAHTDYVFKSDIDLIIKLQHPKMTFDGFLASCSRKNYYSYATLEQKQLFFNKIIPWTFFCSRMMQPFINKEDNIEPLPITQNAFFCGKYWKCRGPMTNKLKESGMEVFNSDQGGINALKGKFSAGKVLTDEEYLNKMKSSKYGLVLHGRGSILSEAKNRREIDYMMLKKPLLLNYRPNYYNPMTEGKHYIYIDEKTDFNNLESMYNIKEIAMNGYQWYKDNVTPESIVKTFLQIMRDKFNEKEC